MLQVENTEYSFSERTGLTLLAFGPGLTTQVWRARAPSRAVLESSISCTRKSVISDRFCLASHLSVKAGQQRMGDCFPLTVGTQLQKCFVMI